MLGEYRIHLRLDHINFLFAYHIILFFHIVPQQIEVLILFCWFGNLIYPKRFILLRIDV